MKKNESMIKEKTTPNKFKITQEGVELLFRNDKYQTFIVRQSKPVGWLYEDKEIDWRIRCPIYIYNDLGTTGYRIDELFDKIKDLENENKELKNDKIKFEKRMEYFDDYLERIKKTKIMKFCMFLRLIPFK